MFNIRTILLCSLTFCYIDLIFSQPLSFDHLSTYDGLSQNSVLCITQDYRGFMWFGTTLGLNRYDGSKFKKYLSNSAEKNQISNNYINCIKADSKKSLWIGTAMGLDRLNLETNLIEKIRVSTLDTGISNASIRCVYEDREGNIWIGTVNGLNLLPDKKRNVFTKFFAGEQQGIAGNYIRCVFEDDENAIWVGTSNGLTKITRKNSLYEFETFRHGRDNDGSLSSNDISAIGEDAAHNIWVGTTNQGLNLFDKTTRRFSLVTMRGVTSNTVRAIESDREGKIWIGALEGIFIFDPLSGVDTLYQHFSSQPHSLSQNSVYSIFHDVMGSSWIGTYYGGVNVTHPYNNMFSTWQNDNTKNSISNDVVSGITEDKKQNVWVSTEGGGLNCINRKTGIISWYQHDAKNQKSIGSNKVKTVYTDREGDLWAGTTGGGLNLFNPNSGTFTHFIFDPANPATTSEEIIALLEDSQGRFWVATRHGIKLFRKFNRSLVPDTIEITAVPAFTDYTSAIVEDSHGNIWLGNANGLFVLKKNEKQIGLIEGFRRPVNCIYGDNKGNLWLGISYSGFAKYNLSTKEITPYNIIQGIPGNQVLSICGDEQDNLWMATDIGLCRMNINDGSLRIFNPGDGIVVGGAIKNAFYKSKSGEFFFGGQNGLTAFFPDKIQTNKYIAPLLFTSLRLLNDSADVGVDDKLVTKDISLTDRIQFHYRQSAFTISFALLSYVKSEKNTYAYKLEGLDKDWNLTDNTFITYTYLPPGQYTLLVKGANSDGSWSKPTMLSIEILPPVWKTAWAFFIYLTIFVIIQFLVIRYFMQREPQAGHLAGINANKK